MLPDHEVSDLLDVQFVEGCSLFKKAIEALIQKDIRTYEVSLRNSAVIGLGAMEQLFKIYLNEYCREKLSPGELNRLDNRAVFPDLLKMMKHAHPPLDESTRVQLVRYRAIRNAAEHDIEKPTHQEVRDALEKIGQLIVLYLPLPSAQKTRVHQALAQLSFTSLEKPLTSVEVRRLFGPAIRLVEAARVTPATDEDIRHYYEGGQLNWNIIFSGGDVERDLRNPLVSQYAQVPVQTAMICLTGEPGAGKTTLSWRIALELSFALGLPLLQIRDNESPDIWYNLEPGVLEYGKAILVLVDDVFRNENARRALESLSPDLPVLIVASSRTNEVPDDLNPSFPIEQIRLQSPTANEKKLVIERLTEHFDLDGNRQKLVSSARSWWVMMLEATRGEDLTKIVSDILGVLREKDALLYRAYQYICFLGRLHLGAPQSLLERIDPQFYNLAQRPLARGILFLSTGSATLFTLHPSFAQAAWDLYHQNPQRSLAEIFAAVRPELLEERLLAERVLRNLASPDPAQLVRSFLLANENTIDRLMECAGFSELVTYWEVIYTKAGFPERRSEILHRALQIQPETYQDWNTLVVLVVTRFPDRVSPMLGQFLEWIETKDLSPALLHYMIGVFEKHGTIGQRKTLSGYIERWLGEKPTSTFVLARYLTSIERIGSIQSIRAWIDRTLAWLQENLEVASVRSALIALAEKKGTDEQIRAVLADSQQWLAEHPHRSKIRIALLGLVDRVGSDEQIAQALAEVTNWIETSESINHHAWEAYMGWIEKRGTPEQRQSLFRVVLHWLNRHPEDTHVRNRFIGYMERKGTRAERETLIVDTQDWLEKNTSASHVQTAFFKLVEKQEQPEQIDRTIRLARNWLGQSGESEELRSSFIGFIVRKASMEQKRQVMKETRAWLNENQTSVTIRQVFLSLVVEAGSEEEVARTIDDNMAWLDRNPQDITLRVQMISFIKSYGQEEQVEGFMKQTLAWLEDHPGDSLIRSRMIAFIQSSGRLDVLEDLLKDVEKRLLAHPNDYELLRAYLAFIIGQDNSGRYPLALRIFDMWLENNPTNKNSDLLKNYGTILYKMGEYGRAAEGFRKVLEINKRDTVCRVGYAWSLFYAGDTQAALAELNHVLWWAQKTNTYSLGSAMHQLGRYYKETGNYHKAEEFFRQEISLAPDSPGGYWELGRIFLARGWPGMALKVLVIADRLAGEKLRAGSRKELQELIDQASALVTAREVRKQAQQAAGTGPDEPQSS